MHIGRRYRLGQTLRWSWKEIAFPAAWAATVTCAYQLLGVRQLALPWLPMSAIATAVAFYLGFKNSASYDRLWEARKIWGAIVNASRSWAFSVRDMISDTHLDESVDTEELAAIHTEMVHRHVAWMDALRHQLRKLKSWEHQDPALIELRKQTGVPEFHEDLEEVLEPTLSEEEREGVLAQINPAAHLLANQSKQLGELRRRGLIDGFGHTVLQELLIELMTQQGKAERIKNFPFPRQYATVNAFFAWLLVLLVPSGLITAFTEVHDSLVWLVIPFSAAVGWVFLTTDKIGDWSENPFEGLANDVPIAQMSRGIERDVRQIIGETELPPARKPDGALLF